MSPPPDGVTAQSHWPCGTAIRTYSLYRNMTPKPIIPTTASHTDIIVEHVEGVPLSLQRIWPAQSRHFRLRMSTSEYQKKSDNWIVGHLKFSSEFLISCKV